jgi:hypothetical protein
MRKLFFLVMLLPVMALSQSNESILLDMTELTVKFGHTEQFIEGMKAYKKCYTDNGGTNKWNTWRRVQGEGSVYVLTSSMAKWAEMDEGRDDAGKTCWINVVNLVRPHLQSVNYNIARSMHNLSFSTQMPETTSLVYVFNVKTTNSNSFLEVIGELSSAIKKAEGDMRGTWYSTQGGAPENADYFIGIPYNNFAAMDVERDGPWAVYEKANGKAKTDALRAKFRASVSEDWSYMYTLNKELSNQ